jgi:hypothetical protein
LLVATLSFLDDPDADKPGAVPAETRASICPTFAQYKTEIGANLVSFNFLKSADLGGRVKLCVQIPGGRKIMPKGAPTRRSLSGSRIPLG